jgi:hypothetical protein
MKRYSMRALLLMLLLPLFAVAKVSVPARPEPTNSELTADEEFEIQEEEEIVFDEDEEEDEE